MNARFDFPDGTLSTEHQALLEALNQFLATLPDDEHQEVAIRLGMELLELADVAFQEEIARAAGYSERTLRFYKQRLQEEGLGGLFDHPIPGRPAITTQRAVEGCRPSWRQSSCSIPSPTTQPWPKRSTVSWQRSKTLWLAR